MKKITIICTILMLFTACATKSSEITASYINNNIYNSWDCDQLSSEIMRLNSRETNLIAAQDKVYKNDQIMGWVGTLLFFPTYFLIKGDGSVASELAQVKGEKEALEQTFNMKKCGNF